MGQVEMAPQSKSPTKSSAALELALAVNQPAACAAAVVDTEHSTMATPHDRRSANTHALGIRSAAERAARISNRLRHTIWRTEHASSSTRASMQNSFDSASGRSELADPSDVLMDENPELACYEELVKMCIYRAGVAIYHGVYHLNPFALTLLCQKVLNDRQTRRSLEERWTGGPAGMEQPQRPGEDAEGRQYRGEDPAEGDAPGEWEPRRRAKKHASRCLGSACCGSAWCDSTRIGGYEVPWVLQNQVLSLFVCALAYDLLFSLGFLALLGYSLAILIDSHTVLCDAGTITDSAQTWADAITNASIYSSDTSRLQYRSSFDSFLNTMYQPSGLCFQLLFIMFSMSFLTFLYFLVLVPGFINVARCVYIVRLTRRYAPSSHRFHVTVGNERKPLIKVLFELCESPERAVAGTDKFCPTVFTLTCGRPAVSARGVIPYMRVAEEHVYRGLSEGLSAVMREIMSRGTDVDKYCIDYVVHRATGSSERLFANGALDDGRPDGMVLADFMAHPAAITAGLSLAHVACLRYYTTQGYRSLNDPLRVLASQGSLADPSKMEAHPFPVTMVFLSEAIKRLRAVGAEKGARPKDLWRGMRNVKAPSAFYRDGGTEFAPMSTSTDLKVAIQYALGHSNEARQKTSHALVLKLLTQTFMDRGADLAWCSAFPAEAEVLYPPLCYLQPTGRKEVMRMNGQTFTVVECVPRLGS